MRHDDASACAWLQAIRYVVNQMDRYLLAQREYRTGFMVRIKHFIAKLCCLVGGKLYGNYLISGYPPPAIRPARDPETGSLQPAMQPRPLLRDPRTTTATVPHLRIHGR